MEQRHISYSHDVKIAVIGVGGAGSNVLRRISPGLKESRVNLLTIDTDASALGKQSAATLNIGAKVTAGFGVGADPEMGLRAADLSRDEITSLIGEPDIVLLVGGLGGGTGTGALPIVAEIARAAGALCMALVTAPFSMEGSERKSAAEVGLLELLKRADSVYVHSNEEMLSKQSDQVTLIEVFDAVNERLIEIIRSIVSLYRAPGVITVDVQDLRAILEQSGRSSVGVGRAKGPNRAVEATRGALGDLWAVDMLRGAKGIIVIVRAPEDLRTSEFSTVGEHLRKFAPDEANIILGTWVDSSLDNELIVTLIVTGPETPPLNFQRSTREDRDGAMEDFHTPLMMREPDAEYGVGAKPIYLLAADTLSHPQIAELVGHLSALYRSVGGDELVVTTIDHVTPLDGSSSMIGSKQLRRTG